MIKMFYDEILHQFWRPASNSTVEKVKKLYGEHWYEKVKLAGGSQVWRTNQEKKAAILGAGRKAGTIKAGRPKKKKGEKGAYPEKRAKRRSKEELLEAIKQNPKLADKFKSVADEVAKLREQGLLASVEPKTRAGKIRKEIVKGKEDSFKKESIKEESMQEIPYEEKSIKEENIKEKIPEENWKKTINKERYELLKEFVEQYIFEESPEGERFKKITDKEALDFFDDSINVVDLYDSLDAYKEENNPFKLEEKDKIVSPKIIKETDKALLVKIMWRFEPDDPKESKLMWVPKSKIIKQDENEIILEHGFGRKKGNVSPLFVPEKSIKGKPTNEEEKLELPFEEEPSVPDEMLKVTEEEKKEFREPYGFIPPNKKNGIPYGAIKRFKPYNSTEINEVIKGRGFYLVGSPSNEAKLKISSYNRPYLDTAFKNQDWKHFEEIMKKDGLDFGERHSASEKESKLPFEEEPLVSDETPKVTEEEKKEIKKSFANLTKFRTENNLVSIKDIIRESGILKNNVEKIINQLENNDEVEIKSIKGEKYIRFKNDVSKFSEKRPPKEVSEENKNKVISAYKKTKEAGFSKIEISNLFKASGLKKSEFDDVIDSLSKEGKIDLHTGDASDYKKSEKNSYRDIYDDKTYYQISFRDENISNSATKNEVLPFKEEKNIEAEGVDNKKIELPYSEEIKTEEKESVSKLEKTYPKTLLKIEETGGKYKISIPPKNFKQGRDADKYNEMVHSLIRLIKNGDELGKPVEGDSYDKETGTLILDKSKDYFIDEVLRDFEGKGVSVKDLGKEDTRDYIIADEDNISAKRVNKLLQDNKYLVDTAVKVKLALEKGEKQVFGEGRFPLILNAIEDIQKKAEETGNRSDKIWLKDSLAEDYLHYMLEGAEEALTAILQRPSGKDWLKSRGIDITMDTKPKLNSSGLEIKKTESKTEFIKGADVEIPTKVKTGMGNINTKKDKSGENYVVSFPYNEDVVADIKNIEGKKYDAATKSWVIPTSQEKQLKEFLDKHNIDLKEKDVPFANIEGGEEVFDGGKTDNPDVEQKKYIKKNGLEYRAGESNQKGYLFMDSIKTIKGKTRKGLMSARVEKNLQGYYILSFPYDKNMVNDIKKIKGRKYDPTSHEWSIPVDQEGEMVKIMERYAEEE